MGLFTTPGEVARGSGRSSGARHGGASRYAVLPTVRFGYFAYYADVTPRDPPTIEIARHHRRYGFGVPADHYLACAMSPAGDYTGFAAEVEAAGEVAGLVRREVGYRRARRPGDEA
jgi:hypothetical protein